MYDKLVDLFLDWNSKINLSAIRDKNWVEIKHIKDSLEWLKIIEKFENKESNSNFLTLNSQLSVVDIGTGSWFPLLPLAIEKSDWNFVGIESVKKKVNAVNDMIEKLWLKNVNVIWTRAEDYKEKQFDILTARAVAYIDKLLKFTKHLVKKWWYFVLYKLNSDEEYKDILKNCKKYNLELVWKYPYKLFDDDIERIIYVLKKK